MKEPKKRDRRSGPPPLQIKRHHTTLSAKETDAVEEAVADLIVNYVQMKGGDPVENPTLEQAERPATGQPREDRTSMKKRGRR